MYNRERPSKNNLLAIKLSFQRLLCKKTLSNACFSLPLPAPDQTDVLGLTQQGRWPDPGAIGTIGSVSDKSAVGVDLCVTLC